MDSPREPKTRRIYSIKETPPCDEHDPSSLGSAEEPVLVRVGPIHRPPSVRRLPFALTKLERSGSVRRAASLSWGRAV